VTPDQEQQIAEALTRLLAAGDESFVIITLRETGGFVQFVAPADDRLLLDVPAQSLADDQRRGAELFFADIGGFEEESQAFQAVLNRGPADAAAVALDALRTVYEARADAEIVITGEFGAPVGSETNDGDGRPAASGVCSLCGEAAAALKRRLWFRHWEEVLQGGGPMVELQHVCEACRRECRRQSLIHLAVLAGVVCAAAAAVGVVILAW
jgi:hypothetical protein